MAVFPERICGGCNRCEIGKPWDVSQCKLCWLYHHDQQYHDLWGGTETLPAPPKINVMGLIAHEVPIGKRFNREAMTIPCRHLGPSTGRFEACIACCTNVKRELFECGVHGVCTREKKLTYKDADFRTVEAPWCLTCARYEMQAFNGSFAI